MTESECIFEAKGRDVIKGRNFRHLIITTNDDLPVHVDTDDRRFCVLRASAHRVGDREYFTCIRKQLEDGRGYAALLYDLLNEDLTGFDPRCSSYSTN